MQFKLSALLTTADDRTHVRGVDSLACGLSEHAALSMTNANSGGSTPTNVVQTFVAESIYTLSAARFRHSGPESCTNSELFRLSRYPLISFTSLSSGLGKALGFH